MKDNIVSQVYDDGMRSFMLNMYNHMASGLFLSFIVAYIVNSAGYTETLLSGALGFTFILAPLAMIIAYSFLGNRWSLSGVTLFYYAFTAILGVGLSTIFMSYSAMNITQVLLVTSATFAGASLYGYTTRSDLTSWGSFLIVGLIGLIIASIVNIFIGSSAVMFAVSILGVLIFTGLTAWDTQNAKNIYLSVSDREEASKHGIHFALSLYLNFINIFQMLLSLTKER